MGSVQFAAIQKTSKIQNGKHKQFPFPIETNQTSHIVTTETISTSLSQPNNQETSWKSNELLLFLQQLALDMKNHISQHNVSASSENLFYYICYGIRTVNRTVTQINKIKHLNHQSCSILHQTDGSNITEKCKQKIRNPRNMKMDTYHLKTEAIW